MSDIDDSAAGIKLTAASAAAVAGGLLGRQAPQMACCPHDGEPLICTFERAGAEFLCMVCGRWFGFLAPRGRDETPELHARYDELKARHIAGERP